MLYIPRFTSSAQESTLFQTSISVFGHASDCEYFNTTHAALVSCSMAPYRPSPRPRCPLILFAPLVVHIGMTKEERLRSGESLMSHAMVFTGYDKREGESAPNKWRVENRYMLRRGCVGVSQDSVVGPPPFSFWKQVCHGSCGIPMLPPSCGNMLLSGASWRSRRYLR